MMKASMGSRHMGQLATLLSFSMAAQSLHKHLGEGRGQAKAERLGISFGARRGTCCRLPAH